MQLQSFSFRGRALPVFTLNGRPAWLARDVGRVLGYGNDGRRLLTNIRDRWADELIPGSDFEVLTGAELERLKDVVTGSVTPLKGVTGSVTPFEPVPDSGTTSLKGAKSATVLYESGLNLVCLLTRKPLGKALRRWLATEVLPAIARGEGPREAAPQAPPEEEPIRMARELRSTAKILLGVGKKGEAARVALRAAHLLAPDLIPADAGQPVAPPGPSAELLHALAEIGVGRPPMPAREWLALNAGGLLPRDVRRETVSMGRLLAHCADVPFHYRGQRLAIRHFPIVDQKGRARNAWGVVEVGIPDESLN